MFIQYLKEYDEGVCPDGGDIRYWDGEVQCSVHCDDSKSEDDDDDDGDGTIPFL